ncbi:MAG: DUF6142 family protein [Faecalimonas sp.]|nr:DUF6142 family protein [Faecalimonas sp.]
MQRRQGEREYNRDKRNRARRRYGQAPLKHAKKGIWSCGIAALVFVLLFGMILLVYQSAGTAGTLFGGVGCVCVILTGIGIYYAAKGFREREKDYLTCKIGMACNIIFLLAFVSIFFRGVFS